MLLGKGLPQPSVSPPGESWQLCLILMRKKSKLPVLAKAEGCLGSVRFLQAIFCSLVVHPFLIIISASWGLGMWVISWLIHGQAPARRTELLQLDVQSCISWVVVCTTLQVVSSALGGCN